MAKDRTITRRNFIKTTLVTAGSFMIVPRHVLGGTGYTAPSEILNHAVIGVGGMGQNHIKSYILGDRGARLLAVCDVDANHLADTVEGLAKGCKGYRDFREVLARDDIDVVHIVTPPHWHGLMSVAAAEAGKDIWCEKPMTRTIREGEKVVEAVQRNGRIFRLNTWFRFQRNFYKFGTPVKPIKKLVDSGLLGWPLRVNISDANGFGRFCGQWVGQINAKPEPVPDCLDYNMWLGPAPYKPYHPHRVHVSFRGYWDYDGGDLGDMCQHYIDPVQYILGKDDISPVEIEADTPQQHPDAVRSWRTVRISYADGCEIILDGENKNYDVPYIEGPGGKLYKGFKSDIPNLKEKLAGFPDPEPQVTDFGKAVRNRQKFALNEANGHRSCTLVNLAKIAVRLGRKLRFDPDKQRFIGDQEANRFIDQPMRAPWHL